MKLGEVATVRSGLVLSRKQARDPTGILYSLLNLRSINPEGYVEEDQLDVFESRERLSPEYLSQTGDVVVRMSAPYTAILIEERTAGIVLSSNFVIIRCNRRELLPEYLFWLINTPHVKKKIYASTGSNMLGSVKAKFFSEFDIEAMSLEKQQRIADISILAKKEGLLLRKLADEKERLYEYTIQQCYQILKRGIQ